MKRSLLTQEQKLAKALEGLEALKQRIIELRFGLSCSKPLTTKEVAKILSRVASPETILKFASHHKHDDGSVSFSEKDVAILEAEALRELSRPLQSESSRYGRQSAKDHSRRELTSLGQAGSSKNDVDEVPTRRSKVLTVVKRGVSRAGARDGRESETLKGTVVADEVAKTAGRGRRSNKSTKRGLNTRKLSRVV